MTARTVPACRLALAVEEPARFIIIYRDEDADRLGVATLSEVEAAFDVDEVRAVYVLRDGQLWKLEPTEVVTMLSGGRVNRVYWLMLGEERLVRVCVSEQDTSSAIPMGVCP